MEDVSSEDVSAADTVPPPPVTIGHGWWRTTVSGDTVIYLSPDPDLEDADGIVVAAGKGGVSVHLSGGGITFSGPETVGLMVALALAAEQHDMISAGHPPHSLEHDVEEMDQAIASSGALGHG